jgi:ELWxxDGT repeat protein
MKTLSNTRFLLSLTSLLSLLSLFAIPVRAGEGPYRLGDLNQTQDSPLSSIQPTPPTGFISLGSRALFSTADLRPGDEGILWSTDGTPQGTVVVSSSLCPAPCPSLRPLAMWHGLALLQSLKDVDVGPTEARLVRSDGTTAGSFPLTGPLDSDFPLEIHAPPDSPFFFFNACLPRLHCTLWRSDGTPEGTVELQGGGSLPFFYAHSFAIRGDRLFFVTPQAETPGLGLWSTDGTPQGTVLLGGVQESFDSLSRVVATPSRVFFASGDTGEDLWVTAGTPESTRRLADFPPVSCSKPPEVYCDTPDVNSMAAFGDAVYFETHRPGHNAEIWRSDGTRPGTRPLIELPAALAGARLLQRINGRWIFLATPLRQPEAFWTVDDAFTRAAPLTGCDGGCPEFAGSLTDPGPATWLFAGKDPGHGVEPWITDGTGPGTRRLADACPGACASIRPHYLFKDAFPGPSGRTWLRLYPGPHADETQGDELWVTDGTPAGTHRVAGRFSEVGFAGATPVFGLYRPGNPAYELWSTDGVRSQRIALLRRLAPSSDPSFAPFQDGVLLLADAGNGDTRLWRSDGMPEGLRELKGFRQGEGGLRTASFLPSFGQLPLFEVDSLNDDGTQSRTEIWRTDGTPRGTSRILDLGQSFLDLSTAWNGRLLYDVDDPEGCSYWTSDGTAGGTRKILPRLRGVRCPTALVGFGSRFLFVARIENGNHPIPQVFVSDGTPAGTRQISAIQEPRDPLDDQPVRIGGTIFFRLAAPSTSSPELWQTDGTPAGTYPAFPLTGVNDLTVFRGDLYFTASLRALLPETGRGLFRIGLPGGSLTLLARISPHDYDPDILPPAQLTPLGDRLLFVGEDSERGVELWVTDGTACGARRLSDLQPGPGSSNPYGLFAQGDRVFFSADDGTNGRELWESDGTPEGTRRLTDIAPGGFASFRFFEGYEYSSPPSFAVANGFLFFGADDGVTGIEPWVLPLAP